jgi:hypothetical protein
MKKDCLKNIKKDRKFLLKILVIIDALLAIFAFISKIIMVKYLSCYMDMGLESDFVVPAIIQTDTLNFDVVLLLLISITSLIGLIKSDNNFVLMSLLLTLLLSIYSLSYNIIGFMSNPFASAFNIILTAILLVAWDLLSYYSYKKQKSLLDKMK